MAVPAPPVAPRTIVYVDGFNLYYGALKNTPCKWLDLEQYFSLLRQGDDIRAVKYFTAHVNRDPRRTRQQAYLTALATRPLVETILGRFKQKTVACACPGCVGVAPAARAFNVSEEKRTDVNIAIHMLDDAHRGVCDQQVLVSGDSDLVPAIQMVRARFPRIRTVVYVPTRTRQRGAATEIRTAAHRHRTLPLNLLPAAQLPNRLPDGTGGFVERPAGW